MKSSHCALASGTSENLNIPSMNAGVLFCFLSTHHDTIALCNCWMPIFILFFPNLFFWCFFSFPPCSPGAKRACAKFSVQTAAGNRPAPDACAQRNSEVCVASSQSHERGETAALPALLTQAPHRCQPRCAYRSFLAAERDTRSIQRAPTARAERGLRTVLVLCSQVQHGYQQQTVPSGCPRQGTTCRMV